MVDEALRLRRWYVHPHQVWHPCPKPRSILLQLPSESSLSEGDWLVRRREEEYHKSRRLSEGTVVDRTRVGRRRQTQSDNGYWDCNMCQNIICGIELDCILSLRGVFIDYKETLSQ